MSNTKTPLEVAAEDYAKRGIGSKYDFIAGAKSEAARDYWQKQNRVDVTEEEIFDCLYSCPIVEYMPLNKSYIQWAARNVYNLFKYPSAQKTPDAVDILLSHFDQNRKFLKEIVFKCENNTNGQLDMLWLYNKAKEALNFDPNEHLQQPQGDAVEFAEWTSNNQFTFNESESIWISTKIEYSGGYYSKELYTLFKSQPPKQKEAEGEG
jgi:hypothetical protein